MASATANSLSFVSCGGYGEIRLPPPPTYRLSLPISNERASLKLAGPCCRFSNSPSQQRKLHLVASLPPPSPPPFSPASTRLFISGLSFSTTEARLRNAFKVFGELLEVSLMMDNKANRPKGFAFLRYATEEESQKAIEGMHGKFLDGRVIFVQVARPRSQVRKGQK